MIGDTIALSVGPESDQPPIGSRKARDYGPETGIGMPPPRPAFCTRRVAQAGLSVLFSLAARPVGAQETIQVPDATACNKCRIEVGPAFILTDRDNPGLLGDYSLVWQDGRQRYYVVSIIDLSRIAVFDRHGTFLTTIGGPGGGPGEFRDIAALRFGEDDSVYIFDPVARRLTSLDSSYQLSRTAALPLFPQDVVLTTGGSVVVAAHVQAARSIGLPLHVLSPEMKLVRSFGLDSPKAFRPGMEITVMRNLAPHSDSLFWAAHVVRYETELWDTAGRRRLSLLRNASWFPPRNEFGPLPDQGRPEPLFDDLWVDPTGVLFTLVHIASSHWKPTANPNDRTMRVMPVERRDSLYDTVIEAIDPARGELLAAIRLPGYAQHIPNSSRVFWHVQDRIGNPSLHIRDVRISGHHPEGASKAQSDRNRLGAVRHGTRDHRRWYR